MNTRDKQSPNNMLLIELTNEDLDNLLGSISDAADQYLTSINPKGSIFGITGRNRAQRFQTEVDCASTWPALLTCLSSLLNTSSKRLTRVVAQAFNTFMDTYTHPQHDQAELRNLDPETSEPIIIMQQFLSILSQNAFIRKKREHAAEITAALSVLSQIGLLKKQEGNGNRKAITQGGGQYARFIALALQALHQASLLTPGNREAITQGGGQYAEAIADALETLYRADLLTAVNRETITHGGGQYAQDIAIALVSLHRTGILNGEYAQANLNAITQGEGQCARGIADALETLYRADLLTPENRNAVTQGGGQYARGIADELIYLNRTGILTGEYAQANRDAITQGGGQYAWIIARALQTLHEADLLTPVNHETIAQGRGQYAWDIAIALRSLHRAGLLTGQYAQTNRDAITQFGGQYAQGIADALQALRHTGLPTGEYAQANLNAITQGGGQYAREIALALQTLRNALLLTGEDAQANFNAITQGGGQYAQQIADGLQTLYRAGLLTQENRETITQGGGQYAQGITAALIYLNRTDLLTPENRETITQDRGLHAGAIAILYRAGLLTGQYAQTNLNAITQGEVQYAQEIADGLQTLDTAGLLTGEHAQANRNAVTQGGGQYAWFIAIALRSLHRAGLLTPVNRETITQGDGMYARQIHEILSSANNKRLPIHQENYDFLDQYIKNAHEKKHGIHFLAQHIKDMPSLTWASLVQLLNNLPTHNKLVLNEKPSENQKTSNSDTEISFSDLDELSFYEICTDLNIKLDVMLRYLDAIHANTETSVSQINIVFRGLFKDKPSNAMGAEAIVMNEKKLIIKAIIEMLVDYKEPNIDIGRVYNQIFALYLNIFEQSIQPQEEKPKSCESVVILLSMILNYDIQVFISALRILQQPIPSKTLGINLSFWNNNRPEFNEAPYESCPIR